MEQLLHNTNNPITVGISKVETRWGSAVRKVLSSRPRETHPDWTSSTVPHRFDYWRREVHVYEEQAAASFAPDLRSPGLVQPPRELPNGDVELLIEWIDGRSGRDLSMADYETAARVLGRAQGRLAVAFDAVSTPWLTRNFLRDFTASKHVRPELLRDDAAWDSPLCRSWPPGLREPLTRLYADRAALLDIAESAPRTLCHLDFWANNLIIRAEREVFLLDWALVGEGALGEDACNLVAEAVLDLHVPASRLTELDDRVYAAYVLGVEESGWPGDLAQVRTGYCASAVKFHWLGPLHLERAMTGGHHLYGGRDDLDPARQYAERGRALAWLCARADEALVI